MPDLTIEEFCELHDACPSGRDWALTHCSSMQECWERLPYDDLLWVAARDGVLTEKEIRLYFAFCCREIWQFLPNRECRDAVEFLERYANGQAEPEELTAVYTAVAETPVRQKPQFSARTTVRCALFSYAAEAMLLVSTYACEASKENGLQSDELKTKQMAWLRANTEPNFKKAQD
jgi:hypothetical protein